MLGEAEQQDWSEVKPEDRVRTIEVLQEQARRKQENFIDWYIPNIKQVEFHMQGNYYAERCFMAGNQLGKHWLEQPNTPTT